MICRLPLWEAAAVPLMLMRVCVWLPVLSCRPTAKGLCTAVLPLAASGFTLKAAITSICLPRKADCASSRSCSVSNIVRWLGGLSGIQRSRPCSMQQRPLAEILLSKSKADALPQSKNHMQASGKGHSIRWAAAGYCVCEGLWHQSSFCNRRAALDGPSACAEHAQEVQEARLEGAARAVVGQLQAAAAVELLQAQALQLRHWVHEQRG